ncbi:MAG TPA: DNA replication/repair protein RecF [bacterium]|nr:DNA replication/repair protein RecF [bacterium]HPN42513.1 DNA replication/repair protein RecF [bacterium]
MYIHKLDIHIFRNLQNISLDFTQDINLIFGDNAQGKTNLIETIYILCLAKSFRTHDEAELAPFDGDTYSFDGVFMNDADITNRVAVYYTRSLGKKIKVDGKLVTQFSKLVGKFPIVILSAEDHVITSGPPAQRRKFFNIMLSQSSALYLDELKKYERILKQKNKFLLSLPKDPAALRDQLEIWNCQLINTGVNIMQARMHMIEEINSYLAASYKTITAADFTLQVHYQPSVPVKTGQNLAATFTTMVKAAMNNEIRRGAALVGPHRDEFVFTISGNDLRKYGSRGEHKSALVSLKAAETVFLKKKTQTDPILLFDDLFAELDIERSARVMELFAKAGQTIITGTSLDMTTIKNIGFKDKSYNTFLVKSGQVSRA